MPATPRTSASTTRRPRRTRAPRIAPPLGSLTQPEHRDSSLGCGSCGSPRVTQLSMSLADGTPVVFVSCHVCEERSWHGTSGTMSVDSILDRSRKSDPKAADA
ncbi:hypothetical protein CLV92_103339 [Kineococcus xinjiangensis]|uniref:Uncharacterized protein n=1 Tax=Kineococcus xinjiangensis TaxID=512762 RepID=A0A2S6IU75_9ACTN|nr:hypothetical protein [Kineococcus xinjiangensis]PPK97804.1 hypothetical protein CLV92_103339 [Kineococcus xinjiangensis]